MANDRGDKLRNRKKLGIAASLCAVTALTFGAAASAASAETISVRPYLFGNIGVGSTAPGDPSSELCLVVADDANTGTPQIDPTYGGLINGSPGGGAGELNVHFFKQDFATQLPTCVPTSIALETVPASTIAIDNAAPKTGGTLQISTIANTPPGIQAVAFTKIRVHLSGGQTVKAPSGAVLDAGSLTGPGTADFTLKAASTTTKSLLDQASCSDEQFVIDTTVNDSNPKSGAPTATPIDSTDPLDPEVGDPGTYVATIRGCAQQDTTVPGKAVTTKIAVTGNGASSVDFLASSTTNPATWDTSRGKSCGAAKYALGTPTPNSVVDVDVSRVLICKGEYGEVIPFSIDVREWIDNTPGQKDHFGLLHPGLPEEILTTTFA